MSTPTPDTEALAPAPASAWGRRLAQIYLVVVGIAVLLLVRELVTGRSGLGTLAISILGAPWSVLLAYVAQAVAPALGPVAMRVTGLVLVVLATLLNARILYGMAARAERDVQAARAERSLGGTPNG